MTRARAAHLGPELRRPLVLDAALPLFAEVGYEAVSMQAIADAAGVSKPVLYSCYASKEELFDELMAREERKLWHMVEDSVPTPGALGDKEDLLRFGLAEQLAAHREAGLTGIIVNMPEVHDLDQVRTAGEVIANAFA